MYDVQSVYDNGGRTFDRYTIVIADDEGDWYGINAGPTGNVPNGVFMSFAPGDGVSLPLADEEIEFDDLPERVQRDVLAEVRGANAS